MTKLSRNQFDLTHDVKLTLNMGNLVPILALECLPGDTHTISAESLIRFAPMTAPVMHRFDVTLHYFFVPNRLVWDNWEKYITNQRLDNGDPIVPPYLTFDYDNSQNQIGSLPDYMGIPFNLYPSDWQESISASALPFAAYQCIYNEYYRDQNLIEPVNYKCQDGFNGPNDLCQLRTRAWEHDYFTACLPWAQKGQAVDIPLGDITLKTPVAGVSEGMNIVDVNGMHAVNTTLGVNANNTPPNNYRLTDTQHNQLVWLDPNGNLEVQPTTINDLRRAFRLQEWLEKAARGGSRYIEWIRSMFGVKSSDARLQRPEYICGSKSPIVISEVLASSQSQTDAGSLPQGNMSGHGVGVTSGNQKSYYCEEHGFIIGIMSVMPKPAYMQGLDRMFSRLTHPTEYYFSSFANIGEQEVKKKELMAYQEEQEGTFGYIPRYAEYRYQPNRICADFRTSLKYWHEARIFDVSASPNLSQQFVECRPSNRIFAVEDSGEQHIYAVVLNKINSIRPIPKYGTPTF